jgi:hypothetical protein
MPGAVARRLGYRGIIIERRALPPSR